MSRTVITGGAGFIGSHLAHRLAGDGWEVVVVDNLSRGDKANLPGGVELIEKTVLQPGWMFECGAPDVVFHLASPCSPLDYQENRVETLQVNAQGTAIALGLAASSGAKFVLASTSEVYGDPLVHPQGEDYWGNVDPIGPRSCYDEGKRFAEALTVATHHETGMDYHIARIFNTYGPHMPDDGRVMIRFIEAALKGDDLLVHGTGEQTRSFCYVDDTVDGLLALAESSVRVANIGSRYEIQVSDLAALVIKTLQSRSSIQFTERPEGDPQKRQPDISRMHGLKWAPKIELVRGIKWTAESRGWGLW